MKQIRFLDSNSGVWSYDGCLKKGINFRDVWQKAKAIQNAIQGDVQINLVNGEKWEDITDWVKRKGA
jgi:hypothetical protein